jgi:hypothetical protein
MTSTSGRTAGLRRAPVLLVLAVLAACGQSTPTPSPVTSPSAGASASASPVPSGSPTAVTCDTETAASPAPVHASADPSSDPNAARYATIEGQVTELRGLKLKTPIERDVLDHAQLCAFFQKAFGDENPPELVTATEQLYKSLLLMPADASLTDLELEMLTSQVAGLYDDKTRKMYVVSDTGEIGPLEEITYAHEYTHALQDQTFGLRSIQGDAKDDGDRTIARTALIEGDATLLMTLWAQRNLTPAQLGEVAGASDPASQAILDRLPAILREPLLFPYLSGLQLALGGFTSGGGFAGVDALFATPPDSTEQVLHADKLASREAPVKVTIDDSVATKLGAGWKVGLQDTLGELQLGIILGDVAGADKATADAAAAGWGGDRVALLQGPNGETAVVLDTVWDTDADATQFNAALAPMVTKLQGAGRSASALMPAPNRVVLLSTASDETLAKLANVLGLAG